MNSKTLKKIRKKSTDILCGWVQSLVSDKEKSKINATNVETFLAEQEYIYKRKTLYLSVYSKKWVVSILKKMVADGHDINEINYEYFNSNYLRYLSGKS